MVCLVLLCCRCHRIIGVLSLRIMWRFVFVLWLCGACGIAKAQTLPEHFSDEVVVTGLDRPVGITFDELGQGYIWTKAGQVYVLTQAGELIEPPLLDISEEVGDWEDHGLMSVALHPAFAINGYMYLLYVVDRHHLLYAGSSQYDSQEDWYKEATIARITRYRCDPAAGFRQIIPDSRKVILGQTPEDGFPILMSSHGAGTLAFGSDGTLLASCGDGASFESVDAGSDPFTYFAQALEDGILTEKTNIGSWRAQYLDALNGKIIRIDPETGEGVPSNPWYDPAQPRAARSRVWTLGLRQPFRFFIDEAYGGHLPVQGNPGRIVVGDIGAGAWEELDVVDTAAANLGWPIWEGFGYNWSHFLEPAFNPDAPNPLYGQDGCSQPFFTFQDLIRQETAVDTVVFVNPCNPQVLLPEEVPVFKHHRPVLSWSNKLWNPPARTLLPSFDELGAAITVDVGAPQAPVTGVPFDGYSALPGFVYRADNFPDSWREKVFFADFSGWIKACTLDSTGQVRAIDTFLTATKGIVHLAVNPADGCMYYVHIFEGSVHKVCYGGTPRPVAVLSLDRQYGPSPLLIQFDGSGAYHPFDWPISWYWDFGDGTYSEEMSPSHLFVAPDDAPHSWQVRLVVTDSLGQQDEATVIVSANNTPPQVQIVSPGENAAYPAVDYSVVQLKGQAVDAEYPADSLQWTWQVFFHHNLHYHPEAPVEVQAPWVILEPVGCSSELYWYRVQLRVTDPGGLSTVAERLLYPWCDADQVVRTAWLAAYSQTEGVKLRAQVSSTEPVSACVLERFDGKHFKPVASWEVPAGELLFTPEWVDADALRGINRYRIRVEMLDGRWTYSSQKQVFFLPEGQAAAYPNPVREVLHVQVAQANSSAVELYLFDLNGQLMRATTASATAGNWVEVSLPVNDLPTGWFVWQVVDGSQAYSGRVLVIR